MMVSYVQRIGYMWSADGSSTGTGTTILQDYFHKVCPISVDYTPASLSPRGGVETSKFIPCQTYH